MHAYTKVLQPIIREELIKSQASRGRTHDKMAENLRISPHSYSNLVNGKHCPSMCTFVFLLFDMDHIHLVQFVDDLHEYVDQLEQKIDLFS